MNDQYEAFEGYFITTLVEITDLVPSKIKPDTDLSGLSVTSIQVGHLVKSLNARFGLSLSPAQFFGHKTISDLVKYLFECSEEIFSQIDKKPSVNKEKSIATVNLSNAYTRWRDIYRAINDGNSPSYLIHLSAADRTELVAKLEFVKRYISDKEEKLIDLEYACASVERHSSHRFSCAGSQVSDIVESINNEIERVGDSPSENYSEVSNKYSVFQDFFSPGIGNQYIASLLEKNRIENLSTLWQHGCGLKLIDFYDEYESAASSERQIELMNALSA